VGFAAVAKAMAGVGRLKSVSRGRCSTRDISSRPGIYAVLRMLQEVVFPCQGDKNILFARHQKGSKIRQKVPKMEWTV